MKVLLSFFISCFLASTVTAAPLAEPNLWVGENHPDLCLSTLEFKKSIQFLRTQPEFSGNEAAAREIADKISAQCTGAFERFSKTYLLLRKSGVNSYKAIEISTDFAGESDATIDSFYEIFQKTYLGEYLNLDFATAINIAYALSKDYKGDAKQARKDFLDLAKFCLEEENLSLGVNQCAKFAVELAKLSQYFPDGTYKEFRKVYRILRRDEEFGISIQQAVNIIAETFKYGPKAPTNFLTGFEYAVSKEGLNLPAPEALKFGQTMAKRSSKSTPPPIYVEDPLKQNPVKKTE